MNNNSQQFIGGFFGFLGDAVLSVVSGPSGTSSNTAKAWEKPSAAEILSAIISNIAIQAKHRAAFLSMQDQPAIRQFLLDFTISDNKTRGDKRNAYQAMKLGAKLLNTMLVCAQKEEKADIFKAYDDSLKFLDNARSEHDEKKRAIGLERLGMSAQRIVKVLETAKDEPPLRFGTKEYQKRGKCEEKTFLKFYETSLDKKITGEKKSEAISFLKELGKMSPSDDSMAVGFREQIRFFEYYRTQLEDKSNKKSKDRAKAFEKACLEVFKYEPQALKDAKHQALCDAARTDAEPLTQFLDQYGKEINLNQRFIDSTQEPVDESDRDAAKNTDDSTATETVLFKMIIGRMHSRVISVLCDKGANVNLRESTAFQRTPLNFAVCYSVFSVLPTLLERKADPCLYDAKGRTPLSNLVDKINISFKKDYNLRYGFEEINEKFWDRLYEPMKYLASKNTVNQKDEVSKNNAHADHDRDLHGKFLIKGATPAFKFIAYLFKLLNIERESKALSVAVEANLEAGLQDRQPEKTYKTEHGIQNFMSLFMGNDANLNETDHLGNTLLHYLIKPRNGYGDLVMTEKGAVAWVYFLCHQAMIANAKVPLDEQTSLHKRIPFDKENNKKDTPIVLARHYGWKDFADVLQRLLNQSVESQPAAIDESKSRSFINRFK